MTDQPGSKRLIQRNIVSGSSSASELYDEEDHGGEISDTAEHSSSFDY
jgi:hypothetical protein